MNNLVRTVHSYLILAYAGSEKAVEDVGFYYAANALGGFGGTLPSGLLYQGWGLVGSLLGSALMLVPPVGRGRAEWHDTDPADQDLGFHAVDAVGPPQGIDARRPGDAGAGWPAPDLPAGADAQQACLTRLAAARCKAGPNTA